MIKNILRIGIVVVFFMTVGCGFAIEIMETDGDVYLGAGETIDDDLFAAGDTITIDGTVNGDLFAFGQDVVVNGDIKGDIIGVSQTLTINGKADDLRFASTKILINGEVMGNSTVASQYINLGKKGEIGENIIAAADNLIVDGNIEGSLSGGMSNLYISGDIGEDVKVVLNNIKIAEGSNIEGDIYYEAEKEGWFADKARIGNIIWTEIDKDGLERYERRKNKFPYMYTIGLLGFILVGLIFIKLFRKLPMEYYEEIKQSSFKGFALGFGILVLLPIFGFFVAITLLGLPLAIFLGISHFSLIYLGSILFAYFVAKLIFDAFNKKDLSDYLVFIVGAIIMSLLFKIPFLGFFIFLADVSLGAGIFTLVLVKKLQNNHDDQAGHPTEKVDMEKRSVIEEI